MTTKNTTTIWGILMALVIAVIAAPVADAARAMRPHGNSTDSISLRVTNDINGDTLPGWGDTITFDMSTTRATRSSKCSAAKMGSWSTAPIWIWLW